jgi:hypothetical protein
MADPILRPREHPDLVGRLAQAIGEDLGWILSGDNCPDWYNEEMTRSEWFAY